MSPGEWKRVGDHEHAAFGCRSVTFVSPLWGEYFVEVDDEDQDDIFATVDGVKTDWTVYIKEVRDGSFRLGGIGWAGDRPDGFWFRIELGSPSVVEYFRGNVVFQIDVEQV